VSFWHNRQRSARWSRLTAARGDWLSGRALRSHRRGHWFEPSIAHRTRRARSAAGRLPGPSSRPGPVRTRTAALGAPWGSAPARPRRSPGRGPPARRRHLCLVRAHLRPAGAPDDRPCRPTAQGRPLVAGERGRGLPAVQRGPGPSQPGGLAGGVPTARLGARRASARSRADCSGRRDLPSGRPAPCAPVPGRATSAAPPPERRVASAR
jgi:hypothetical protein